MDLLDLCARKESIPMTPAEEIESIQKIKGGDKEEQNKFLGANVRLIVSRVKKFCSLSDPRANDLVNEGALGLIRAIKDFDPYKNYKFSTYAVWWIDANIRKGLKFFKKETIASPNTMKKRYDTAKEVLKAATDFEPTEREVGKYLNWSIEDLTIFQKVGGNQKTITRGIDESTPCEKPDPQERADEIEMSEKIATVLNRLTPAEEDIIRRRYGIGTEEQTLVQIAAFYSLAKERIRQIENAALRKLFVFLREKDALKKMEGAED